jgi:hypothetical protein
VRSLEETVTEPDTNRDDVDSESHDTTHDFNASSHERVQLMADDTVFEPGPSFVENERPTAHLTEMPAWLQTFAASEDTADDTSNGSQEPAREPAAEPFASTLLVEPDATLPDWLRAEPSQPKPVGQVETLDDFDSFEEPDQHNAASFISEDDLPDWLRAFSQDTSEAPAHTTMSSTRASTHSSASTSTTLVRVPPTENVWLSTYERQALGPGRTLFALLASNGGAATFVEANGTNDAEGAGNVDSADTANTVDRRTPAGAAQRSETAAAIGETEKPRNSTQLLLLALLVVLLLLFVSYALLA